MAKQKIKDQVTIFIFPKVKDKITKFIEESKQEKYFLANTFYKRLGDYVYKNMKEEIKKLEELLYIETIMPKEQELNEKYKVFIQSLRNSTIIVDDGNSTVLTKLSKNIQGTRIKRNVIDPRAYIWSKKGASEDYNELIQEKIKTLLNHEEI